MLVGNKLDLYNKNLEENINDISEDTIKLNKEIQCLVEDKNINFEDCIKETRICSKNYKEVFKVMQQLASDLVDFNCAE